MDLTREVIYRGFTLNPDEGDISITGGGGAGTGIVGCVLDSADVSDVDVIQYLEKRSQADGMDAGDAFFGARRIRLAGTLYARTRLTLFDDLADLRAALNAVLAQREEPLDKGYRPLYFSVPTNRTDDYPEGVIELQVYALPRAFQALFNRDQNGGSDADSLAIPWQATLICKDPGLYAADPVDVTFTATTGVTGTTGVAATNLFTKAAHGLVAGDRITFSAKSGGTGITLGTAYFIISSGLTSNDFKISATSGGTELDFTTDVVSSTWVKSITKAGSWTNRGTYLGTFNMVVEVGAAAGRIVGTVGDSVFTITMPVSSGTRIIRLKGTDKVLTVEEDDVEVPRMDLITFSDDTTWPRIDAGPTSYSVTFHGMSAVVTGSHMWFYEQYA